MMRTKCECGAWIQPPSQSLRMVPVTKTRVFRFLPREAAGWYSHSGSPRCVGTCLPACVEDGKPLVPWDGNPWI